MSEATRGQIRLQVAGAKTQDFGKALARIGQHHFERLGIREGDVLEIIGKRPTGAIALRAYAEDEGLDIIRLDGLQRANADVGLGDPVEVRRADAKPARRVVLAPAQNNLRLMGSGEALRRTLLHRPSSVASSRSCSRCWTGSNLARTSS